MKIEIKPIDVLFEIIIYNSKSQFRKQNDHEKWKTGVFQFWV